jgi:hypothetical protein
MTADSAPADRSNPIAFRERPSVNAVDRSIPRYAFHPFEGSAAHRWLTALEIVQGCFVRVEFAAALVPGSMRQTATIWGLARFRMCNGNVRLTLTDVNASRDVDWGSWAHPPPLLVHTSRFRRARTQRLVDTAEFLLPGREARFHSHLPARLPLVWTSAR